MYIYYIYILKLITCWHHFWAPFLYIEFCVFNQTDNMKMAFEKLDHNQPMLIYCAAGGRSNKTRVLMAEMGFTQVYELSSGMGGWEAAGKPISLK